MAKAHCSLEDEALASYGALPLTKASNKNQKLNNFLNIEHMIAN